MSGFAVGPTVHPTADSARPITVALGLLSTVALAVIAAALFLPHQSLWVDEATQLSGLTLSPSELVRWLADGRRHDFGVPADWMPPLSYWLGWGWAHLFGLTETSMRWFGTACVGLAVALLFRAAHRLFGLRAAIFAGAFLALSPNVCVTAVEIRAYPLFLLTTAGAIDALSVLLIDGGPRAPRTAWIALGVWLVAGIYTHFFGLILAGAVLTGLGLFLGRSSWRQLAALAAAVVAAAMGLRPFVRASIAMSPGGSETHRLHEVAQLFFRLVAHPTMNAIPVAIAAALLGATALGAYAAYLGWRKQRALGFLLVVLTTGLAVTVVAAFAVHGFTAAKTSYATWALPLVSLILAAPAAIRAPRGGILPLSFALLFLGAQALGTLQLWRHGEYFAHGPTDRIARIVDEIGAQETAVIHVASPDYASVYFPLRYLYGPALAQFVVGPDHPVGQPLDIASSTWPAQLSPFRRLLVVRAKVENGAEIGEQLRHGERPFAPDPNAGVLSSSPSWRVRSHQELIAFVAADVTVLERSSAP